MIQEVKFQGLSHSPSDYEAQDGELGTCLNLICEDGSLHPIPKPESVESFTIPNGATIEMVHKVTHGDSIHSHYIIRRANGTWYWTEKGGDGTTYDISLDDFNVNAVTAVGNIICFVGDNKVVYAFWKESKYIIFSRSDFVYSINVSSSQKFCSVAAEMGDEYWDDVSYTYFGTDSEDNRRVQGFNATQMRKAFNAADAIINNQLADSGTEWVKGTVFGVAAIRLYDGTYYNISNIFVLAPAAIARDFYFHTDEYGDKSKYFTYEAYIHKDSIVASMNLDRIGDLVQGVDVFITEGDYFLDIDRAYKTPTYINTDESSSTSNTKRNGYVTLYQLDIQKLYDAIDSQSFYHALFIDKKDFGKTFSLKRPVRTEESISLANFNRADFGGKVAITYNNRLHIGNIDSGHFDTFPLSPTYSNRTRLFGKYLDLPLDSSGQMTSMSGVDVEIIAAIVTSNNTSNIVYNYGNIQYPFAPVVTIPINDAQKADLYMKKDGAYYHKSITLHSSSSFGASYFINTDDNGCIAMLQINDVTMPGALNPNGGSGNGGTGGGSISSGGGSFGGSESGGSFSRSSSSSSSSFSASRNGQWEDSDLYTWNKMYQLYKSQTIINKSQSLVKVSEAENPLVFPAKNSVQVGSSIINALSSNTRPISEGQFGDAPLYAFTDEGVWVLMLDTDGTYESRQPANREVCSNANGILQIDNAVLFPTDRGIMLQNGSSCTCITDQLEGYPFDFTQLYKYDYAKKVLATGGIPEADIKYVRLREFLKSASMIYDYYDSRIIVFNPSYTYAYVYSLKSKMWGTMHNVFNKRVNIYPESYATDKNGNILNVYIEEPTADIPYFLCSRPLALSSNEVYKTMFSCIARGYFRDAASGKCGLVLYGSNDLFHWFPIKTSVHEYLRGMAGSPYKYFRIVLVGSLSVDESISGLSTDFQERWQNKLR